MRVLFDDGQPVAILGDGVSAHNADVRSYPNEAALKAEFPDWVNPDQVTLPAATSVPASITPRQARLVLLGAGLLDDVEAALAQAGKAAQLSWEYSNEVRRGWPLLLQMSQALGMSSAQVDQLFIAAAKL